ncbi:hypothetical protein P256_00027 [Acinetobacter nectaris CIP 110549]|uniref:Uncharacterized protein n=1 Tax=Acinetobacter nectaris CIP 110549 TaxID=1392540 RepID=V2TU25_9GAMM|nr:hypothetical protein [Acinetobacter nectaris]ESK41042.1 hypothetical protein P256_00027 [Acinetobacter nectaris CIP 110549]
MTDIECPYCGAKDDDCVSDLWEIEGEDNELECGACKKQIIVNAEVSVTYDARRMDCAENSHEYGDWKRYDYDYAYEHEKYSLWARDCKYCDDSEIIKTAYKADLPSSAGE